MLGAGRGDRHDSGCLFFFFSSRRRHTRFDCDWSSDVCSSDLKNLVTRVREREGQGELERLSVTDGLTGLYNRRHLMGTLANEVQRSRRLRRAFSVLLADVDHFKQYNDTHGHLGGDAVLVKIAEILRQTTRGVDSVARYGGEGVLVLLFEAPVGTAAPVGGGHPGPVGPGEPTARIQSQLQIVLHHSLDS